MRRAAEVDWVLDHLSDLDADFLRFYGRDYRDLDGPRFLALANRVAVYGGVVTMRFQQAQAEPAPHVAAPDDDTRWVDDRLLHLTPEFAGLVERATV